VISFFVLWVVFLAGGYGIFWLGVLAGERGTLRVSWPKRLASRKPQDGEIGQMGMVWSEARVKWESPAVRASEVNNAAVRREVT
jgi:hypothetical protein